MMKRSYEEADIEQILDTARSLKQYRSQFYTCHCTGTKAFDMMKKIMGERLQYVHCGEFVSADLTAAMLDERARRKKDYMKWHKFFAWATVFCFIITMITGYKKR